MIRACRRELHLGISAGYGDDVGVATARLPGLDVGAGSGVVRPGYAVPDDDLFHARREELGSNDGLTHCQLRAVREQRIVTEVLACGRVRHARCSLKAAVETVDPGGTAPSDRHPLEFADLEGKHHVEFGAAFEKAFCEQDVGAARQRSEPDSDSVSFERGFDLLADPRFGVRGETSGFTWRGDHVSAVVDDRRHGQRCEDLRIESLELAHEEQLLACGRDGCQVVADNGGGAFERFTGTTLLAEKKCRFSFGRRVPVHRRLVARCGVPRKGESGLRQLSRSVVVARDEPHRCRIDARVRTAEPPIDRVVELGCGTRPPLALRTASHQRSVLGQSRPQCGDVFLELESRAQRCCLAFELRGSQRVERVVGRTGSSESEHHEVFQLSVVRVSFERLGRFVEGDEVLAPSHGGTDSLSSLGLLRATLWAHSQMLLGAARRRNLATRVVARLRFDGAGDATRELHRCGFPSHWGPNPSGSTHNTSNALPESVGYGGGMTQVAVAEPRTPVPSATHVRRTMRCEKCGATDARVTYARVVTGVESPSESLVRASCTNEACDRFDRRTRRREYAHEVVTRRAAKVPGRANRTAVTRT